MTQAAPFGRILTAMVTPFSADGSVDLDGVAAVTEHLIATGHDGLVVSGTTGEAPTTTVPEDGEILRAVIDAAAGRAKVVAGVGTNSTAHSVELAQQAAKLGADGMLLVTPYYNKPPQAGVLHHFRSVVEAADLPVMLYDVPGRTVTSIALETYAAIARYESVVAVKDAVGDYLRGVRIMQETGLSLYSGDDANNLGWLAYGAVGVVSVVGHVAGNQTRRMYEEFTAGDHAAALATFTSLVPAIDAVMGVPNYGATTAKAALELAGVLDNRRVRGPLVPLDDAEVAALRIGLEAAGLLAPA